jgi:uncharacterized protein (DUF2237 family)
MGNTQAFIKSEQDLNLNLNKYKLNVFGTPLKVCSIDPLTGYARTGSCSYNIADEGTHLICGVVNNEFLRFTRSKGNDLISPSRGFPGLKDGDKWCLCVNRWIEAYEYDPSIAPRIIPESTHMKTLSYIPMRVLEKYFI